MNKDLCSLGDFSFFDYIGQTVTVFTISGGAAGAGFTGILISVNESYIRLLAKLAAPPECPIGYSFQIRIGKINTYNKFPSLGSIVVIPVDKITAFVHNTI